MFSGSCFHPRCVELILDILVLFYCLCIIIIITLIKNPWLWEPNFISHHHLFD